MKVSKGMKNEQPKRKATSAPAQRTKRTSPKTSPARKTRSTQTEVPDFVQNRSPQREKARREQLIRQDVKRKKKRRKKNYILYYILLAIILLVTGIALSLTVFFNIETIRVEGNKSVSEQEIIAASGVQSGDNLIRLNMDKAEKSVISQFITLDEAEIIRDFPTGLTIRVREAEVIAVVRYSDRYYAVSRGGRVVGIEDRNRWMGVPEIAGCNYIDVELGDYLTETIEADNGDAIPANANNKYDTMMAVLRSIEANSFEEINYIDLKDITTIKLYYQDRIEMKFGSITNLDYELSCVKTIIETETTDDGYYIVDDTLGNGRYYISQPESLTLPLTDKPPASDSGGDNTSSDTAGTTEDASVGQTSGAGGGDDPEFATSSDGSTSSDG